jgi:glycosyltransferase involved in cell wall biosynthesis
VKIAIWSPWPPAETGVADYAIEQARDLARGGGVEVVLVADLASRPSEIAGLPVVSKEEATGADLDLYHLGNSPAHGFVLRRALDHPGVVLLHEVNLQELWLSETVERNDSSAYAREMRLAYGSEGLFASARIASWLAGSPFRSRYPLTERIVESSLAVVTPTGTSRESRGVAPFVEPRTPRKILRLPHHLDMPLVSDDRASARARFGIAPEAFVIVAPGLATAEKRIDVVLRSINQWGAAPRAPGPPGSSRSPRPPVVLMVAGAVSPVLEDQLREYARALFQEHASDSENGIVFTGRLDLGDFTRALIAADVVSLLRHRDRGEMSGALIRTLGVGRPALVSAGGTLSREFPEGVLIPILPSIAPGDELEERHLAAVLEALRSDEELRSAIGERARAFARDRHDAARAAADLSAFLHRVWRERDNILPYVGRAVQARDGLEGHLLRELRNLRSLGGPSFDAVAESLAFGFGPEPEVRV